VVTLLITNARNTIINHFHPFTASLPVTHLTFIFPSPWSSEWFMKMDTFLGPNVLVECLTLLLRIREVPGSNLSPETGCPECWFSWFVSVPAGECRNSTLQFRPRPLPAKFFPIYHSLITLSFDAVYSYILKKRRKINYKPRTVLGYCAV
jgi:hypothetical protein